MNPKKKVLAICGSNRKQSSNLSIIKSIMAMYSEEIEFTLWPDISSLPHFNPDLDKAGDTPPVEVIKFRKAFTENDAILICTPEYAMGVPGVLKDAIDWTVSSSSFSKKPTALITASSMGQRGHAALMETLNIIEAKIPKETQLVISYVKTKMGVDDTIADPSTSEQVMNLIKELIDLIDNRES